MYIIKGNMYIRIDKGLYTALKLVNLIISMAK